MVLTVDILSVGGFAIFAIIRFFVVPRLEKTIRTFKDELYPRPDAIANLAAVRFLGTFSGLTALGAGIGKALIFWVESIDVTGLATDAKLADLDTDH